MNSTVRPVNSVWVHCLQLTNQLLRVEQKKKKKEKKKRKTQNRNANARFSVIQTGTKNLLYENEKYQTVSAGLFIVVSLI